MIKLEDALEIINNVIPVQGVVQCPLKKANDRILAEDIIAPFSHPPFDASAMDGFAISKADAIKGRTLKIIGTSAAGKSFQGPVQQGQTVRIFTGAPLPENCDSIIIQENTTYDQTQMTILDETINPKFIRPRGIDFKSGQLVLKKQLRIAPRHLMLAASLGLNILPVYKKPNVMILASGDELIKPGKSLGPDQIYSSVPYGLKAMVENFGAKAKILDIVKDNPGAIVSHFKQNTQADLIVTIGGVSVGDYDYIRNALEQYDVELHIEKLAMRPGKPCVFGEKTMHNGQKQYYLGLPGNPVSSLLCARLLGGQIINSYFAQGLQKLPIINAKLSEDIDVNGQRKHFMRAILKQNDQGDMSVTPARSQDSSLQSVLSGANGLIIRKIDADKQKAGSMVRVLPIDF